MLRIGAERYRLAAAAACLAASAVGAAAEMVLLTLIVAATLAVEAPGRARGRVVPPGQPSTVEP